MFYARLVSERSRRDAEESVVRQAEKPITGFEQWYIFRGLPCKIKQEVGRGWQAFIYDSCYGGPIAFTVLLDSWYDARIVAMGEINWLRKG